MDILANPYVSLALLGGLLAAAWKIFDQWRDNRQKTAQKISQGARELGLEEFPDFLDAYARDDHEEMVATLKSFGARLAKEDGPAEVAFTIVKKTWAKLVEHPVYGPQLQAMIRDRLMGLIVDEGMEVQLAQSVGTLQELGLDKTSQLVSAVAAKNLTAAKTALHSLVAELVEPDGFRKVAMRVLPKTLKALKGDKTYGPQVTAIVEEVYDIDIPE